MQMQPHQVQQSLSAAQLAQFKRCNQPLLLQGIPTAAIARRSRHPAHHMQITQTAW